MGNGKISNMLSEFATACKQHSPEILTGAGIAGFISTTVLAVMATPKAMKRIGEERAKKKEHLTKTEVVKATWKYYAPAAASGVLSTACLIGSCSINTRRNAALATAYSLSESALRAYSEKVIETIGEKKEQQIRDAIAKDEIEKNPVSKNEIIITGKGTTKCYDVVSARYFEFDIEKLRRIENELNRRLMSEHYISLSEFYDEIGLSHTKVSDDLGWNIEDDLISFSFSSQLDEYDTPCLVVDYRVAPRYDYRSFP